MKAATHITLRYGQPRQGGIYNKFYTHEQKAIDLIRILAFVTECQGPIASLGCISEFGERYSSWPF